MTFKDSQNTRIIPSNILQCTIVQNKEPKNGCCLENNRLISLSDNACLHKHCKMFEQFRTINIYKTWSK